MTMDVNQWLEDNWTPGLSVGDWWQALADNGLSNPMLPEPWGRGWDRKQAAAFASAVVAKGALGPPAGTVRYLAVRVDRAGPEVGGVLVATSLTQVAFGPAARRHVRSSVCPCRRRLRAGSIASRPTRTRIHAILCWEAHSRTSSLPMPPGLG